jgi:flagellar hook-basal body complex protein FliE
MAVGPILPISGVLGTAPTAPTSPGAGSGAVVDARGDDSFASVLGSQLDQVSDAHARADQLALQAATGDLQAVHDYTIAATEAQLLTQLTVAVRNKAVEAFNDIMRMQV